MRRIAITGLGIVSVLGQDLDTVSQSLQAGKSGIVASQARRDLGFASPLTGQLSGWDGGKSRLSRKLRRSMAEPAAYAAVAALDALEHSGLDPERLKSWDVGCIMGNDSTVAPSAEVAEKTRELGYTSGLGAGAIFQVMNSTVSMNLSTMLGTRGANWTLSAACASGAHALGQAHMLIGSGSQEIVVCGGAQELSWESMAAFDALGAFSSRDDQPEAACRPFAKSRDGLVPSGGGACLILESWDHAVARGADIHAELVSYAFSSNGGHLSCPTVEGPTFAMKRALELAHIRPDEIDYVSAHATATPVGDLLEGRSLLEVFGRDGAPVSSTKSMTGHECWMSGASEVIYSLLMMRDGFLAPNINLDELDPELAGLNVVRETRSERPRTVLSNSFGFGGTNSALVIRAA